MPLSAATCGAPTSACAPPAGPCCQGESAAQQKQMEGPQQAAPPGTPPCAGWGRAARGDSPSTLSSPSGAWRRLWGWGPGAPPVPWASSRGMAPAVVSVHRRRALQGVWKPLCAQKAAPVLGAALFPSLFAAPFAGWGSPWVWLCREGDREPGCPRAAGTGGD